MSRHTVDINFLKSVPPFKVLPIDVLEQISDHMQVRHYAKNMSLTEQGSTPIESVLILQKGIIELHHREKDFKQVTLRLKPGDTYGGISLLMNSGIALRSAKAVKDLTCICLPKKIFLDLCDQYKNFYNQFADTFRNRIEDETYATVIAVAQAPHIIGSLTPFNFLSPDIIQNLSEHIALVHYPRNTVMFVQGVSQVNNLYIIKSGAAERFYEEANQKTLRGILGEGDMYGGISMLINNSISVRTLKTTENSFFYTIPKMIFMDLCLRNDEFRDYFTDTFGKRMLDRSYAQIIARNHQVEQDEMAFFSQPVSAVLNQKFITCGPDTTIQEAARLMRQQHCSAVFIQAPDQQIVGVVTESDLSRKVVAEGCLTDQAVQTIMSHPLISVPQNAMVFEALMTMMQTKIKHLAVTDHLERVKGLLTNQDLLYAQGHSPLFLIRRITKAESLSDILDKHAQLPRLLQGLINSGAKPRNVTRVITTISDAILERIIEFVLQELPPPPVPYVFMTMGSEGRKEQTLKTDQDNAIIFADVADDTEKAVKAYFLNFGERVCGLLDQAGYTFCKGEVMAQNPKWCLPLEKWKQQFKRWIYTAEPEALLQASIFFDFRYAQGDQGLTQALRRFLHQTLAGWPGFFRHMTENALYFKPPIGFFRNFVVESKGEHRNEFDIKKAMMPIVDFARVYALKHNVEETNTLERLFELYQGQHLTDDEHDELTTAYSYLMQLRFARQIETALDDNTQPNNYINPNNLTPLEQTMLREIFKRIEKYQGKMSFDFIG